MKIHYATGNFGKFEEAALILSRHELKRHGWQIVHTPLSLEEIQGSSTDIAKHKVREAYAHLQEPCMVDDVALYCPAIGQLPGPYIRSFLEALGDKGLWELLSHYEDRRCTVSCLIAFLQHAEQEPIIFEGTVTGTIVEPRGVRKGSSLSWNPIVKPDGYFHTFAEMTLEEMSLSSPRNKALVAMQNYLLSSLRELS